MFPSMLSSEQLIKSSNKKWGLINTNSGRMEFDGQLLPFTYLLLTNPFFLLVLCGKGQSVVTSVSIIVLHVLHVNDTCK